MTICMHTPLEQQRHVPCALCQVEELQHEVRRLQQLIRVADDVGNKAATEIKQLRGTLSLAEEGLANYQWQPIETAPERVEALFWIRPGTRKDGDWFCDTSGNPILAHCAPRIFMGPRGGWSSLMKATRWMPLPAPPQSAEHPAAPDTK